MNVFGYRVLKYGFRESLFFEIWRHSLYSLDSISVNIACRVMSRYLSFHPENGDIVQRDTVSFQHAMLIVHFMRIAV